MDKPSPFQVELRPSRLLAGLLGGVHGGALLLLPTLPIAAWIAVTLSVILVTSAVLTIRLKSGGIKHVVILGDGIDVNDFRRLRVWLRWGPRPSGAETDPA